jgi:trigger factor
MQVTVENPGGLQRRLTVQVPGGELQQQIDARLREIGKTAKLKGFRPGKIPMNILKQRFGPSVRNEVVGRAVETNLMQAIQQEALQVASQPVVEKLSDLGKEEPFEFVAMVEVYPEFDKIDPQSLSLSAPEAEVSEADLDDMLETLRKQRTTWEAVERKPKKGEQVLIEYAATTDSGRIPAEGMSRLAVVMGRSGFDALEKTLSGLSAGEESEVELEFPGDFNVKALAGVKGQVAIKVDSVRVQQVPEIDEEFIKSFSVESGQLDDMKTEVRANLERELKSARLTYLKAQMVKALLEAFPDLEVPAAMVREEAKQLLKHDARQRNQEPDAGKLEQYMDSARKRVKSGLLINEIASQNDILVDGAKVREAIETVAETYEQSQEVVQLYYNNPDLLRSVEGSVLEEQVVDWVLDNAKVTSEPMSFKDLINAAATSRQGL